MARSEPPTNAAQPDRDYPFHTDVIGGLEVAGVMFDASSGGFYEFLNPEEHDDYERYRNPRTGDVVAYDSTVQRIMADVMNGRPRATVPADKWAAFREYYSEADKADHDAWASRWRKMADSDPQVDGGRDNVVDPGR
jgi:hypothetical protein